MTMSAHDQIVGCHLGSTLQRETRLELSLQILAGVYRPIGRIGVQNWFQGDLPLITHGLRSTALNHGNPP